MSEEETPQDEGYEDEYYDDEDYEPGGINTLDYVLRGQDLVSVAKHYVRATPWWVISVALHFAAALVLVRVMSMSRPAREPEDLFLEAQIKKDEPEPLDLKKIERVFEEIKKIETERVINAPQLVQRPEIEMTETPDFDEDLTPDMDTEFVDDTDFVGIDTAGGDEDVGQVGGEDEDILGAAGGFNVRHATNYDSIMSDLSAKLTRVIRRGGAKGGNVLLVWIMDASVSMKDDQQAIKERLWEMDKKFREQKGSGDLKQAVVYYGDRPHLWLQPTSDVEQVMQAIENIEISPPGTVENTMQAVIYSAQTFNKSSIKARRVGILVDDDSADDSSLLETALGELRKAKMTLFAINRECPFQSTTLRESFEWVDEDGDVFRGSGTVHRGPETARPELTGVAFGSFHWGHWGGGTSAGGRILSGFGIYDISRLAYYTRGAYYILDPKPHDLYDWDLMESYRPELVSRAEYEKRTARNPFKRTIQMVAKQWNHTCRFRSWTSMSNARENFGLCGKYITELEKFIRMMATEGRMSDTRLTHLKQNRRWPANADLVWCQLVLARHRLRQWGYGLEEFLKHTRAIPKNHNRIGAHWAQKVKDTSLEKRDREAVIQAMRYVANRHPRTPWGYVASSFDPSSNRYLFGYKFYTYYYFHSYWAKLVTHKGKVYIAHVIGEDKKKKTITFTVPKKGTKTAPRSYFKSITRLPPNKRPSGVRHNPHPRI